jgi:energy-coupling factor transport system ATP-binding protein
VKPIIEVKNLNFYFQNPGEEAFQALRDISMEIGKGELVALVGANGSGKTTLARHLNGLLLPTSGDVWVDGLDTCDPKNLNTIRTKVGMVFQFPEDQIVATSVNDDVAFGLENEGLAQSLINKRVKAALQEMDLWKVRTRPPTMLSGGQMQRLALAGILAREPEVILMDEPTGMLDPAGRRAVWEQIEHLRRMGKTILLITHDMDEAARVDRIIVLHKGRLVFSGSPISLFSGKFNLKKIKLEMPSVVQIRRELELRFKKKIDANPFVENLRKSIPSFQGDKTAKRKPQLHKLDRKSAVILAHDLFHTYMKGSPFETQALRGVTFRISPGSIHGFIGVTGSGKSTLLQHLDGLYRPQHGSLEVAGLDLTDPNLSLSTICRKVGLAFQNPENQFFNTYVGDEIAYAARQLNLPGDLAYLVKVAMLQVGLDFEMFKDRPLVTLSGGEQRKVSLASILVMQPEVLVLDEPTAGLDPFSRKELLALIRSWKGPKKTIILSSQNMEDIAELTDSVTVLDNGKVVMEGPTWKVFGNTAQLHAAGLEVPAIAQVCAWFRHNGWPIPMEAIRLDQLRSALKKAVEE